MVMRVCEYVCVKWRAVLHCHEHGWGEILLSYNEKPHLCLWGGGVNIIRLDGGGGVVICFSSPVGVQTQPLGEVEPD